MMGRHDLVPAVRGDAPIEKAERFATDHNRAAQKLVHLVRGPIEDLFGHTVAEALLPVIENVTENAGEAMYHFRAANDELREEALRWRRGAVSVSDQRDEALALLRTAVADDDRRQKRRAADPPEWVTRARSLLCTSSTDVEPF